jgi:Polyketide cyclase / dehydrase and lipid transport
MKLLLIVSGGVVALVLLIFIIGALLPKAHVATRSAAFRVPAEKLFAIIDGPPNWRSDIRESAVLPGESGKKRWRETDRHGRSITYELVERRPTTLLKTRIADQNLPYSGSWTLRLTPNGDSTLLRITEEGEVYNPAFRFMSKFVFGQTGMIESYLRDLAKATGQTIKIEN